MMKKFKALTAVMVVMTIIVVQLSFVGVVSAENTDYTFTYSLNEDGKSLTLTKFTELATEAYDLVIPDTADYYTDAEGVVQTLPEPLPVTVIADGAFITTDGAGKEVTHKATSLTFGNNITTIGTSTSTFVFRNFQNVTGTVVIPDNVTTIYSKCFFKVSADEFVFGKGVTTLNAQALSYCTAVDKVTTYATEVAGTNVFDNCKPLNEVYFLGETLEVKNDKFASLLNAQPVFYAENAAVYNYLNETAQATVKVGSASTTDYLSTVKYVPYIVIKEGTHDGITYGLQYSVDYDESNNIQATLDGFAINETYKKLPLELDLVIPASIDTDKAPNVPVKAIAEEAFSYETYASNANIENLSDVKHASNKRIYILKTVSIPEGVTSIGNLAFYGNTKLISANIPGSVGENLGGSAFKACSILNYVDIAEGVTSIPTEVFYACQYLSSVVVPSTVTEVKASAFTNCHYLKYLVILGNPTVDGNIQAGKSDENGTTLYLANPNTTVSWKDGSTAKLYATYTISSPLLLNVTGEKFSESAVIAVAPANSSADLIVAGYEDENYSVLDNVDVTTIGSTTNATGKLVKVSDMSSCSYHKVFLFNDLTSIKPLSENVEL